MHRPSVRVGSAVRLAAIPLSVVLGAGVVWQASQAAFTATTSNPTNNWSAGSVALSDDDSNTAMFAASNLKPGSTGQKCIAVTSTGTLPATVKLYATGAARTNGFDSYLNLTVEQGTGGGFSSCTGFTAGGGAGQSYTGTLAGFTSTYQNFGTGLGTFAPTGSGPQTATYRFTYTVDSATPNSAMNGTAASGFTWESASN